jgi:hypothetical protein
MFFTDVSMPPGHFDLSLMTLRGEDNDECLHRNTEKKICRLNPLFIIALDPVKLIPIFYDKGDMSLNTCRLDSINSVPRGPNRMRLGGN